MKIDFARVGFIRLVVLLAATSSCRKSSSKSMSRDGSSSERRRVEGSLVLRRRGVRGEEPGDLLEEEDIEERFEVDVLGDDDDDDGVMRLREGAIEGRRGGALFDFMVMDSSG